MEYRPELIGDRIRNQRKHLGLTQEALAERLNISPPYLGQIENGRRGVNLQNLIALAKELDVTLEYLVADYTAQQVAEGQDLERQWLELFRRCAPDEQRRLLGMLEQMLPFLFPG